MRAAPVFKASSLVVLNSLLVSSLFLSCRSLPAEAAVLIGNTEGNNIVEVDEKTGNFLGEFISPFEGFESPDTLTYGPDGNLYISSGDTPETSAIYRFDGQTGALIDKFASGGDLFRPYGLAFGPDGLLYVSSFRSDKILRYDGATGKFVDVFAQRDGTAEGLNGPNGLLFGPDGNLYVTTEGSVADEEGNLEFLFPSQVLKYDIESGEGKVFVPQPDPFPTSLGFVSFLGLSVGPEDNNLYVSDFANGIRRYSFETAKELAVFDTNYTETDPSSNFIGNLAFGPDRDLYTVGFDTETTIGSLLKFDPMTGDHTVVVSNAAALKRPVGLLFRAQADEPTSVLEPSVFSGLLLLGLIGSSMKRRHRMQG